VKLGTSSLVCRLILTSVLVHTWQAVDVSTIVDCVERVICQGRDVTQYSHVPRVVHTDTDVWCIHHWPTQRWFYARSTRTFYNIWLSVYLDVKNIICRPRKFIMVFMYITCLYTLHFFWITTGTLKLSCDNTLESHSVRGLFGNYK